jgi:hypothetical protein
MSRVTREEIRSDLAAIAKAVLSVEAKFNALNAAEEAGAETERKKREVFVDLSLITREVESDVFPKFMEHLRALLQGTNIHLRVTRTEPRGQLRLTYVLIPVDGGARTLTVEKERNAVFDKYIKNGWSVVVVELETRKEARPLHRWSKVQNYSASLPYDYNAGFLATGFYGLPHKMDFPGDLERLVNGGGGIPVVDQTTELWEKHNM